MSLIIRLLKIAGKENFQLDSDISVSYMWMLIRKYGWMMIRGRRLALGRRHIANDIFAGRHVKILEKKKLSAGSKTTLHDFVYIDALSREGVILGEKVVLGRGTRIECSGSLSRVGKGIQIGNRTTFGNDCFFGAAGGITIGEDVIGGQYIRFHSENHNYSNLDVPIREQGVTRQGIKVGNNCWIGSGAVFLDGAELGDGCVVAANAVVTGTFPANTVIGGIPARELKKRGERKI